MRITMRPATAILTICFIAGLQVITATAWDSQRGDECVEGQTWKADCNSCGCTNGYATCTMMACAGDLEKPGSEGSTPPTDSIEKGNECVDGTTWREACNTCSCDNGFKECTLKACRPPQKKFRRPVRRQAPCIDGTTWEKQCNRCWCANGNELCSRRTCPE